MSTAVKREHVRRGAAWRDHGSAPTYDADLGAGEQREAHLGHVGHHERQPVALDEAHGQQVLRDLVRALLDLEEGEALLSEEELVGERGGRGGGAGVHPLAHRVAQQAQAFGLAVGVAVGAVLGQLQAGALDDGAALRCVESARAEWGGREPAQQDAVLS